MHDYLRAVGFSQVANKKSLEKLLKLTENFPETDYVSDDGIGPVLGEKVKEFSDDMGIVIRGEYDEEGHFLRDYYFPYFKGSDYTMTESVIVEKHSDKNAYVGICDNPNVGVSMIFHLSSMGDYVDEVHHLQKAETPGDIILSGLSISGKIILPVMKTYDEAVKEYNNTKIRNKKIIDARNGDQEAIESLTLEDLDLYTMAIKRTRTEDVLSIVETYFMPYGIACDQYSILANILDVARRTNVYTMEKLYVLKLECNNLIFDICINESDLLGEPKPGRRFRGNIWLQGNVSF